MCHCAIRRSPSSPTSRGRSLHTAEDIRRELADNIVKPVNWTRSVLEMVNGGGHTFVEVGPGKVLSGLIHRISADVKTVNVQEFVADHLPLGRNGEEVVTRRVVITGLGAVCPVGNTMPEAWDALMHGRSGVGRITLFDPCPFAIQIAGEVKDFSIAGRVDAKQARHMDRHVQMAVVAAQEALADAGLEICAENADRVGVIVGSAAGGVQTILDAQKTLETRGPDRVNPFFLPNFLTDASTGHIAIQTGASGPNMATVSACATGGHALGEAMHTIKRGDADAMIAGGDRYRGHADHPGRFHQHEGAGRRQRASRARLAPVRPRPQRLRHLRGRRRS